jgi:hypothetical protein
MRTLKKLFLLVALVSGSLFASAQSQNIICSFQLEFDYFPDVYPELVKSCSEFGGPLEAGKSFAFRAKANKKYASTDSVSGIPKENGVLVFKPVSVSSFNEKVGRANETRWLLNLIDNSGSPSRAEERFVVIDGAFKPLTKLLSHSDKEAYIKARPGAAQSLGIVPMKCNASSQKK